MITFHLTPACAFYLLPDSTLGIESRDNILPPQSRKNHGQPLGRLVPTFHVLSSKGLLMTPSRHIQYSWATKCSSVFLCLWVFIKFHE